MNSRGGPGRTVTTRTAGTFRPRQEGFGVVLFAAFARHDGETASTWHSRTGSLEAVIKEVERLAQIFAGFDDRRVQIGRNDRRSEPIPMSGELADQRFEQRPASTTGNERG